MSHSIVIGIDKIKKLKHPPSLEESIDITFIEIDPE